MATIASIAAEYDMQPEGLRTLAALHLVAQDDELDDESEAFLRDLIENTDADGVYRG